MKKEKRSSVWGIAVLFMALLCPALWMSSDYGVDWVRGIGGAICFNALAVLNFWMLLIYKKRESETVKTDKLIVANGILSILFSLGIAAILFAQNGQEMLDFFTK